MPTLRDEIIAGGFDLQHRDDGAIAAALSAGRKKLVVTEIGLGSILNTIGFDAGNALLDALYARPEFRYVTPLIEQGRLDISSVLARSSLDALAQGGVIAQQSADALKALAEVDNPVGAQDVARALEGL
jgi:hypothetical protein